MSKFYNVVAVEIEGTNLALTKAVMGDIVRRGLMESNVNHDSIRVIMATGFQRYGEERS